MYMYSVCGFRAKDTEGVQCIGLRTLYTFKYMYNYMYCPYFPHVWIHR